jgi:cytochrome o ubiquinol oxidase operon protein cyoD
MNNYFEEIGLWPRDSNNIASRYVLGFVISLLCTLGAYFLVMGHVFSADLLLASVIVIALVQVIVQLEFFLHLGTGLSARARLIAFGVAIFIIGILVAGSLWIMYNLNQRMMPSMEQMEQYMNDQVGF